MSTLTLKRWPTVFLFLFLTVFGASARHYALADSQTANSMSLIVLTSINPTINNVPMGKGDEIGVFDSLGACYGVTRWDSVNNQGFSVWGANPPLPGMNAGAKLRFRVWDSSQALDLTARATFAPHGVGVTADSTFVTGGIAQLASLTAVSVPLAPFLATPTNGATGQTTSPALTWAASTGAITYGAQVSTVSTFATTVSNQTGLSVTTASVTGLANSTTYFWRANATNAAGTSAWSSVWSFATAGVIPAAPALTSPANAATNQALSLALTWAVSTGATTYAAQVSTISTFATTVSNQTGLSVTSASVSGLANSTTYFWRANASNSSGTSAWSTIRSFTTVPPIPAPPVLATPANAAANQAIVLALTWAASTGAATYGAQVSTVSTFATTVSNQSGISVTTASVSGLTNATTYFWRANATNSGGTSAWSSVWSFTTIIAIPPAPVLATPANATTNQAVSLALTWAASARAATYAAQVSTISTFATTISNQTGLSVTSASVSGLANSTTYFWRANATNAGGTSAWSTVWSFTTIPIIPAAPVLATPANAATNQAVSLALTWAASTGAATYGAQVSTISTFATTVSNQTGLSVTTASVSGLAYSTTYFWRANATNAAGSSAWSGVWSFTTMIAIPPAPVLATPANAATAQAVSLALTWAASTGAATYGAQASTVSTFATTVSNQTGLSATSASVSGLANGTTYFWRVNATNAGGTSAWSSIWSFTTVMAIPPAPVLATPTNASTNQATAQTLTWAASTGAATYGAQVSTASTFATTVSNQTLLTATSASVSGLALTTTYFWRANATNSAGTSVWSTIWSFTTTNGLTPPAAPTLTTPANGATAQAIAPVLTWSASAGAASYGAQVSTVSTFATTISNQTGLSAATTTVSGLSYAATYFWRANASNTAGTSAWSSVWSFTILTSPAAPALAVPSNGATGQAIALALTWGASANAATYAAQVSTVSTFATTVSNQTGLSATTASLSGLAPAVTFFWRANAANAAGTSLWSSIWSFTTLAIPSVPTLSSPANAATNQPNSLTLTWNASIGAGISYRAQVSSVSTFATLASDQTSLTTTTAPVSGLASGTAYYWRVNATNGAGTSAWSSVWSFNLQSSVLPITSDFSLSLVELKSGSVAYSLAHPSMVQLSFFDILGRQALLIEQHQSAGSYSITFHNRLAAGSYILRFRAGNIEKMMKVMVTR